MLNVSSLIELLYVLINTVHEEAVKFQSDCCGNNFLGKPSYASFLEKNNFNALKSGCYNAARYDDLGNFDFEGCLKLLGEFLKNAQSGFTYEYNQAAADEKPWLEKTLRKLLVNSFLSKTQDFKKIDAPEGEIFIFIIGLMMEMEKAISLKVAILSNEKP